MGGGAMLPAMGGGGATIKRPYNMPKCHKFQNYPSSSVISRVPFRPPLTESGGLAEVCDENLQGKNGNVAEIVKKLCIDSGFGPNPSRMEVDMALSQLHRYMENRRRSESEGLQQVFPHTDSRMLQHPAYGTLNRAFGLFENDPSMQSMVMSISCDKSVWDAIISNKSVQDLQGSLAAARQGQAENHTTEMDTVNLIVKWITGFTKSKVAEMVEKFLVLLGEIFVPGEKEKPTSELTDLVEEKIRSSLLLSVVIILIVVVTRNNGA